MFLEVLAFTDHNGAFKIANSNVENGARWYRQPKGHQIWGFYQENLMNMTNFSTDGCKNSETVQILI